MSDTHIITDHRDAAAVTRRRLSSRQAAEYVGLSEDKMRKLRMAPGGCVFMKIDGRVIYDTADLDAWMESKLRASNKGVLP